MDPLSDLNPEQRAAVLHRGSPLLVLAGAGSGKTRVIVHRIASLVEEGAPPWSIFAVTFTNKAAREMRERVARLLGPRGDDVWVSTFHSAGASILRREGAQIGISTRFSIYDDADQLGLARRVLREANREADTAAGRDLLDAVGRTKNGGEAPSGEQAALVERYGRALRAANAVDFDDLLLLPVELFAGHPDVLERWRQRFRHVLVDEFQDTNAVQYRLLELLCPPGADLCVVGDDDQSIYRWRGAEVSNILGFEEGHPGAAVVKLERNYRSDGNILAAAGAVIARNPHRHAKTLWTDRPPGEKIALLWSEDERGEADRIAALLHGLHARGTPFGEMAVFYRINAQSRVLEEGLRLARIPYVIVRGRSFYERAEVKDAVAYLRLVVNPRSDVDLLRVINSPPRKIGETTIERISRHALGRGLCLYDALAPAELEANPELDGGSRGRLAGFRTLLDGLIALGPSTPAARVAEEVLARSGLVDRLNASADPEAQERVENLRELVHAASEADVRFAADAAFDAEPGAGEARARPEDTDRGRGGTGGFPATIDEGGPLLCFLEEIALLGEADGPVEHDRVSLMTLHAAKGLEFDAVVIAGMEEGVFPHSRAVGFRSAAEDLAEERRLCYVGFTRARRKLAVACAQRRALFGELRFNPPSRFLGDVPPDLFDRPLPSPAEARPSPAPRGSDYTVDYSYDQTWRGSAPRFVPPRGRRPAPSAPAGASAMGLTVRHSVFGVGRVVAADGEGPDAKLTVRFPSVGEKRIVARFVTPV